MIQKELDYIETSMGYPFDFAQGGESFDFAQDREPVERPIKPRISTAIASASGMTGSATCGQA